MKRDVIFLKDFFFLFIHDRHREREAETQAEGEVGSKQEPDVGLDPGTPGSCPGPKAGTKPLSHHLSLCPQGNFWKNP